MSKGKSLAELIESLKKEFDLKSLSATENDGVLKLHNIEVQKDSRGSGVGSKVMEKITDYADKNNLQMTLTPDVKNAERGTTSASRLIKFYKKFDFLENKGKNKDFSLSDSMYRSPKNLATIGAIGSSGAANALSPQAAVVNTISPTNPLAPSPQMLANIPYNKDQMRAPVAPMLLDVADKMQGYSDWRDKNLPAPVNWLLPFQPDPEYVRNRAYGREPTKWEKVKFGLSFL